VQQRLSRPWIKPAPLDNGFPPLLSLHTGAQRPVNRLRSCRIYSTLAAHMHWLESARLGQQPTAVMQSQHILPESQPRFSAHRCSPIDCGLPHLARPRPPPAVGQFSLSSPTATCGTGGRASGWRRWPCGVPSQHPHGLQDASGPISRRPESGV
jgi:hypothetical protein